METNLKITDAAIPNSLTHRLLMKHLSESSSLYERAQRQDAFNNALYAYLNEHEIITYDDYCCVVAWFEHHPELSIEEIFRKLED